MSWIDFTRTTERKMKAKISPLLHRLFHTRYTSDGLPGTASWLCEREKHYGGLQSNVERRRVSPADPRTETELRLGGMLGGDRMCPERHGYAPFYEKQLRPFFERDVVLLEVGILRGTGLALWADLFPNGRILGLDIDLSHVHENMATLRSKGAFSKNNVELHEFDQLVDGDEKMASILQGRKIDIAIDDGLHNADSIKNTFTSIFPHLKENSVYICEDNFSSHVYLRPHIGRGKFSYSGEISAIRYAA